jgi:hypothetical protein
MKLTFARTPTSSTSTLMCDGCLRKVAGLQVAGCVRQRLYVTERTTLNAQPATFFVQQNLKRIRDVA